MANGVERDGKITKEEWVKGGVHFGAYGTVLSFKFLPRGHGGT
jgi:hypothetical protein